jgi:cytochrome b subunit of formate dehydrogenase
MAYTISRKSWHFRLYRFYLWLKEAMSDGYYPEPEQICLCPYVRALLIWLPLRLAVSLAITGLVLFLIVGCVCMAFISMREFGWVKCLIIAGKAVAALAALAGAIWVVVQIAMKARATQRINYEPKTIAGQWVKANHEKICPCFQVTD